MPRWVTLNTRKGAKVAGFVRDHVDDNGKSVGTFFPANDSEKDNEQLQADVNTFAVGPGTGHYEYE